MNRGSFVRPILIVPGYGDSGPGHWQTLFETKLPGAERVRMPSFDAPDPDGWIAALDHAIAAAPAPPVLVAHSLGCIAVARWAITHRRPVHGALLVAPADVEKSDLPAPVRSFAPIPTAPLEFPSILVASTDDPYLELVRAQSLASSWDSFLTVVENAGHLNVASGHGSWLDGELLLGELL
jgi:predicted alpha/beta hydrolase family esterase